MKTEQDATGMFGNCHWLNMHLMLTRGPVAGAWATLRMRRQNFPRPGWVKHRRMCELAVSSPLFSLSITPWLWLTPGSCQGWGCPQDSNQHTPYLGHFEFRVMGFGLCNAPATFQSLMNDILRPYLRKFIAVFLDDILIFSKTWEDHLEHVGEIMEVLQRNQLFCKPSKCIFGATEILHLGHFVSGNSIRPDPKKLAAVEEWPVPELITQVRSFLVFANYFRRFIPRFAEIAQPLDEVTGRHAQFSWNKKRQDAFDSCPCFVLLSYNFRTYRKPFRVHTDANDVAIGLASATSQLDRNAWQRVATYKSGSKQTWRRIFFVWNHIEKAQTDRTPAQLPLCWAATARFFLSSFFRFRFRAIF